MSACLYYEFYTLFHSMQSLRAHLVVLIYNLLNFFQTIKIPDIEERKEIQKRYEKFIEQGNKLDVIAIPDEEQNLPKWFIPDVKAALKFCFTARHELMMKPIASIKNDGLLTI